LIAYLTVLWGRYVCFSMPLMVIVPFRSRVLKTSFALGGTPSVFGTLFNVRKLSDGIVHDKHQIINGVNVI
jgi:hypothetical protein